MLKFNTLGLRFVSITNPRSICNSNRGFSRPTNEKQKNQTVLRRKDWLQQQKDRLNQTQPNETDAKRKSSLSLRSVPLLRTQESDSNRLCEGQSDLSASSSRWPSAASRELLSSLARCAWEARMLDSDSRPELEVTAGRVGGVKPRGRGVMGKAKPWS